MRWLFVLTLLLGGCRHLHAAQDVSVEGLVPPLALSMTDVETGKPVTAASFKGAVTLLYFGYTNCPDVCPATLYNVDKILRLLGPAGSHMRFLFVTVDPDRDTPAALAQYVTLFGPQIAGLRGNADQLFALARRYRVVFSVTKTPTYSVTHSSAVYVFDAQGKARFIISGLESNKPDFAGIAKDLAEISR